MDDHQLEEIEDRAAKATRGPWVIHPTATRSFMNNEAWTVTRPWCDNNNADGECEPDCGHEVIVAGAEECEECFLRANDADFIAHARIDVPALAREVRRLRALEYGLHCTIDRLHGEDRRSPGRAFGFRQGIRVAVRSLQRVLNGDVP